jgi:hypothetical protein
MFFGDPRYVQTLKAQVACADNMSRSAVATTQFNLVLYIGFCTDNSVEECLLRRQLSCAHICRQGTLAGESETLVRLLPIEPDMAKGR